VTDKVEAAYRTHYQHLWRTQRYSPDYRRMLLCLRWIRDMYRRKLVGQAETLHRMGELRRRIDDGQEPA